MPLTLTASSPSLAQDRYPHSVALRPVSPEAPQTPVDGPKSSTKPSLGQMITPVWALSCSAVGELGRVSIHLPAFITLCLLYVKCLLNGDEFRVPPEVLVKTVRVKPSICLSE